MYDRLNESEIRARFIASHLLRQLVAENQPAWKMIVVDVCAETGVSMEEIFGSDRTRYVAHARQECFLRIRDATELSLPYIGRLFKRDHTTVLHGIRAAENRRSRRLSGA